MPQILLRSLVNYIHPQADVPEKIGNFLLKPVRLLAGRCYLVNGQEFVKQPKGPVAHQVLAFLFVAIFSSAAAPATIAGFILTKGSKSHKKCARIHEAFLLAKPKKSEERDVDS